MLNNLLMKCGHPATCIMEKVRIGNEEGNVAACDQCFNYNKDVNQDACIVKEKRIYKEVYPTNYALYLIVFCAVSLVITMIYLLLK